MNATAMIENIGKTGTVHFRGDVIDHLPRWARDALTVTRNTLELIED